MKDQNQCNNRGGGLAVILYGITLLLILIFAAINFVNSKVIENGYNSLRDAVQAASSGSVIHLLTSNRETTSAQSSVINKETAKYDIYLQLALGYLINRNPDAENTSDVEVQTGELNNFIKLDHQKVVNSTLALMEDAVYRDKNEDISNTDKYKIIMIFIEPYEQDGKKYFDIIAYGNGGYDPNGRTIVEALPTRGLAEIKAGSSMKQIYQNVQAEIGRIVNSNYIVSGGTSDNYTININASGSLDGLVRDMQTYPHYLIVVKDFALPTIFDGEDTNTFKKFFSLSGEPTLKTPMCALNTGKVQRQTEDAGWDHRR